MDPVSAFGLISGAFQVGQVITETLAGLASLREKYQHADLTIGTLEQQLRTIRAAITHLEDWTRVRLRESPAEYSRSLDVALDGCRTVMEALSNEVLILTQNVSSNEATIGFRTRMRVVWREDVMRGHQDRLHSQVVALQLLVQACQCQSSAEQVELLRKAENRHIIWKVADDAATLRSSTTYTGSRIHTPSTVSQRESSTGDTVFDFDRTLATTLPYLRVPQRPYSRAGTTSTTSNDNRSQTTDEGYASGMATSTSVSRTGSLVLPGHPSGTISPTIGHSNSATLSPTARTPSSNHTRRSKSDSGQAILLSQSAGSKREKIQSVFRRFSQTSMKSGSPAQGPTRGLTDGLTDGLGYTRRRPHDRDVHTSIDLTSVEGASAPLIVKTAQTGSWTDVEKLIERGCDLEARHLQSRRTALLVAAHCGNEAVVDLLIRKNARIDAVDKSGSTALHLAASRGHCGVLELLLLSEGTNLEARDSRGRTTLWVAAERGEIEATHLLLLSRAKVNSRADGQMTALHAAAKQGDDTTVRLLASGGADIEAKDGSLMTALHYACEKGHVKVIEILLDNKINVDVPGSDKRTPLICAAAVGELSATKSLLKRKASSRCVDDAGMTALHWAAYNGHTEVVEILSSKKGSLAIVNVAKRTALHLAAMNSQFAVVELLLRKQVPTEMRCQSGLTALHYACLANSTEISKLLLMSGAHIEAQIEGELQRRPVHIAAIQGSMGLLNLLCDKGAALEARDSLGYRALGVACRAGHAAAVQNLLDRGSPVHLPPDTWARDDSPLCLAAMGGHLPVIALLLERGASVLKQDEQEWWPYQHTAYHGHPRALELLLSRTLVSASREGLSAKLQLDTIGFAPAADISDGCKKEVLDLLRRARHQPESLASGALASRDSAHTSGTHQANQGPQAASRGPVTAHHISSLGTVPETANRAGSVQELPGTLEQGLPDSRSQTPEQMHRPLDILDRTPPRPISGTAIYRNISLAPGHSPQALFTSESQQLPTPPGAPLSHPTPVREPIIQPDGLLRNADLFGARFINTPVSVIGGSATRGQQACPFHNQGLEFWTSNRAEWPVDSDSDSFSTASEGTDFPSPDIAELPA
ncbi:ankyrin repeat protein [Aspergillus undulatus]|uniref:ankyrin repeat protein n=1 Tax=Aspergillus undulatus TaxID=1810928 RepID=UPI003CCCC7AC